MNTNTKVIDPVCGMEIDATSAAASATYDGETYYFCANACAAEFSAAPRRYAGNGEVASCCSSTTSCCS